MSTSPLVSRSSVKREILIRQFAVSTPYEPLPPSVGTTSADEAGTIFADQERPSTLISDKWRAFLIDGCKCGNKCQTFVKVVSSQLLFPWHSTLNWFSLLKWFQMVTHNPDKFWNKKLQLISIHVKLSWSIMKPEGTPSHTNTLRQTLLSWDQISIKSWCHLQEASI